MSDRSDKIDLLVQALVKAHAEMPHPAKDEDADTGKYKYKYAALPGVIDAVRPVLARHGLAVLQTPGTGPRGPVIHTTVLHESGQWLALPELEVPAGKQDAQGYGSAITYGRRYALLAACGVTGDKDDDDAQAAVRQPSKVAAPRKVMPVEAGKRIAELANRLGYTEGKLDAAARRDYDTRSWRLLGPEDAEALLRRLEKRAEEQELAHANGGA